MFHSKKHLNCENCKPNKVYQRKAVLYVRL